MHVIYNISSVQNPTNIIIVMRNSELYRGFTTTSCVIIYCLNVFFSGSSIKVCLQTFSTSAD